MEIDFICLVIKYFSIYIGLSICYFRIINNKKTSLHFVHNFIIVFFSIFFSIFQCFIAKYIPPLLLFLPLTFLFSILLHKISHIELETAFVTSIISLAISYITSLLPMAIGSSLYTTIYYIPFMNYVAFIVMLLFHLIFLNILFKFKRLKYGFSFLNNDYLRILILFITIILILAYTINENFTDDNLIFTFFILMTIFIIIIKQSFIIYHKQKLQNQALKDYEKELAETKQKLQVAIDEKERIVKSNHEFYHRQEALKNKLNIIANSAFNSEIAEEISSITSRINNLSEEYNQKCTTQPKLVSTNIEEIDDMLLYFQNECTKNNIEFSFKLECNINKILDNFISKSQLETLIGDLLRNAIIAVNHSENSFRSIMLVLGLHDDFYEIDVYDSGINFEINTLINLGITKSSTHLDEGGTGIGFITTFETLNNCKASLIITELDSENYTKIIGIRFDNQKQYIINSARASVLKENNLSNRDIIFNNKKEANI